MQSQEDSSLESEDEDDPVQESKEDLPHKLKEVSSQGIREESKAGLEEVIRITLGSYQSHCITCTLGLETHQISASSDADRTAYGLFVQF